MIHNMFSNVLSCLLAHIIVWFVVIYIKHHIFLHLCTSTFLCLFCCCCCCFVLSNKTYFYFYVIFIFALHTLHDHKTSIHRTLNAMKSLFIFVLVVINNFIFINHHKATNKQKMKMKMNMKKCGRATRWKTGMLYVLIMIKH